MKVNLIDSTTISMCIEKFEWAKYRKRTGGIKLHVMLDSETQVAEQVLITNAVCHDMNAIRDVIEFKKGQMYVYDRGYACYNYLYDIELAGAYFVTRLKSNWKIKVIKNRRVRKGTGVKKDQLIRVTGSKKDEYPKDLRLVTFYHKESKKTLQFLTNNMRLSSKRIADIYKSRWQIELFFKWMKQHLKVKTFLSTTANGVKIQIWCALITHVILQMIKALVVCEADIFMIYRRIQDRLFEGIDLFDLLTDIAKRRNPPEDYGQQELQYA
jgi:IS4 transposase